jgi:response regulator NasT
VADFQSGTRDRVLLVDDEPLIAMTVAESLRRAHFDVAIATDASAGLDAAHRSPFALVILDYAMPGRDGLVMATELAALRRPFMFLSAYSDEALVRNAIAAGALSYVVKPIDPEQFVPIVRAAVVRASQLAELAARAERMAESLETGRDVSVAIGLVMAQRGLSRKEAHEALRQHARRTRRRLRDVAAAIVSGAELLYAIGAPTAEQVTGPGERPG